MYEQLVYNGKTFILQLTMYFCIVELLDYLKETFDYLKELYRIRSEYLCKSPITIHLFTSKCNIKLLAIYIEQI